MTTNSIDFAPIINAVILIIAAIVARYAIPAIKQHTTEEERKKLMELIKIAVEAAEQAFKKGDIKDNQRKDYVLNILDNFDVDKTYSELDPLIESAVNQLPKTNPDVACVAASLEGIDEYVYKDPIPSNIPDMDLVDTIPLMESSDYKKRMRAEYLQNGIRMRKLHEIIEAYDNGTLKFTLNAPIDVLRNQLKAMDALSKILSELLMYDGVSLKEE